MSAGQKLRIEYVDIDTVRPLERNPRRGDVEFIRGQLKRFGQYVPIVVREETGEILKGNHTWHALKEEGAGKVAIVRRSEPDDDEAMRLAIGDNHASDLSEWDVPELHGVLAEMPDLQGTGFDAPALEALATEAARLSVGDQPIPAPPTPEPPKCPTTRLGDVIQLGAHRLMCGDCTKPDDMAALMGGELAGIVFTDPPYGVSYRDRGHGSEKERLKEKGVRIVHRFEAIEGDDLAGDQLLAFLVDAFSTVAQHATKKAALYTCHASRTASIFEEALGEAGYQIRAQIIWVKSRPAFNMGQYKYRHEPIFYAFRTGSAPTWLGDHTQSTVWEVPSEIGRDYEHPTQKPPALAVPAILNSSSASDIVLDPFAGSGSTLIAADHLSRRCNAMELHPGYCDVIVQRWEELTGEKANRPARQRARRKKEKTPA